MKFISLDTLLIWIGNYFCCFPSGQSGFFTFTFSLGLVNAHFLPSHSKPQPGFTGFIRNVIFNLGNFKKVLRSKQQISYKAQSSHEYLLPKVIFEDITHFPKRSQHLWIFEHIFFITFSFFWSKWKKEVPILHKFLYWMLWKIFFYPVWSSYNFSSALCDVYKT